MKELRASLEARAIRRAKIGGFDIDGVLRGKYVSLDKLWSALDHGFGFCDVVFGWDIADVLYDNATLTGWHTGYPDTPARLDVATLRVLPYEPDAAHFLVDFLSLDGTPHPACPRGLLKKIIARAEAAGYRPKFAAEFEFWVFKESPDSMHGKGFRNLQPLSPGMCGYSWVREGQNQAFLEDILSTMEAYDIEIEALHTETGPGVYEAAIRYDDALRAADKAALFKATMKQIASRHGLSVTFMAKWNASLPGSSGHLHQSLWSHDAERNLFADANDPLGLSRLARHYIGGQVALMPELTALYSPFVNSYKRYVPGVWAPLNASWAFENRTCAVRVIGGQGGKATRVEYRQTAADINPYIAMASCLGAGLYGIAHSVEPQAPAAGDATAATTETARLPLSLAEAVGKLSGSRAAREILGETFVDHYVRTREWEVRQHQRAVTDWELARYFEMV